MATPEEIASHNEQSPDLRLIPGGLAVEKTVIVSPVDISLAEAEFRTALHGLIIEGSSDPAQLAAERQVLLEVREAISAERHDIADQISELSQRFDELTLRQIRVNGYLKDRP